MNETLALALDNYQGFPLSHSQKRGLFDGLGHHCMLFGTAMNEDVEKLRDRYTHLSLLAFAYNKAIHLNSKRIARLEQHLLDIASHVATLRSSLNNVLTTIKSPFDLNVVGQALPALENTVNSFLRTIALVFQNMEDTARGRDTSSLFSCQRFR